MKLKLSEIRLDGGTQARVMMDKNTIEEYTEALLNGAVFPPITVFDDGVYKWVGDGFYRFNAHKNAKIAFIEADVIKGTVRDAIDFSLRANSKHGKPRTIEDKRKAVTTVLNDPEWCELSDREIASKCEVSHPFVAKVRKELDTPRKVTEKAKPKKTEEKPSEVENLVPAEEFEISHEDQMKDLAGHTEELAQEVERLKTELFIVQMDDLDEAKQEVKDTIDSLRERVKLLEAEVEGLKASRNHYQTENAELKKSLAYWKKMGKKAA